MSDDPTITHTVIPALPGWHVGRLALAGTDEESGESWPDHLFYEPIIAWEIEHYIRDYPRGVRAPRGERKVSRSVLPLTFDGCPDEYDNPYVVKRSDGKYEMPLEGVFDSETKVIEYMKEEKRKDEERRSTTQRIRSDEVDKA
jgi:hypothetical protein